MADSKLLIDWDFIKREEGMRLFAYIPGKSKISGVTVAVGLDLGKHTKNELLRWGISPNLVEKVAPFCMLQQPAAAAALTKPEFLNLGRSLNTLDRLNGGSGSSTNPLAPRKNSEGNLQAVPGTGQVELSKDEAEELWRATRTNELKAALNRYRSDAAKCKQPDFNLLSSDTQTAFASLLYQYGHIWEKGLSDRRRQLWEAAIRGEWGQYIEILFSKFMGVTERSFLGRRVREMFLINRARGVIKECPLGPEGTVAFNQMGLRSGSTQA